MKSIEQKGQESQEANSGFQVVVGSGMGLLSSDEITNYGFYNLVEKHVLTDSIKHEFGLKLWVRFKDDIFYSSTQI